MLKLILTVAAALTPSLSFAACDDATIDALNQRIAEVNRRMVEANESTAAIGRKIVAANEKVDTFNQLRDDALKAGSDAEDNQKAIAAAQLKNDIARERLEIENERAVIDREWINISREQNEIDRLTTSCK